MGSEVTNLPQIVSKPARSSPATAPPSGDHLQTDLSTPRDFKFPAVSVIIPTLNEAMNLPYVLPLIPEWVYEVILVDGLSTDNTVAVAKELYPDIRIVLERRPGKGLALMAGCAAARGEIIVMMDADGSNDPAEISRFVGTLISGADFAKGSRFLQGGGTSDMPFYRKVGNWSFVKTVQILFGGRYSDLCYGYNAFWTHLLPRLNLGAPGFEIESAMNIRALIADLTIVEVPSFETKRIYGEGRLRTIPDGWRVLRTIWGEWLIDRFPKSMLFGDALLTRFSGRFSNENLLDD